MQECYIKQEIPRLLLIETCIHEKSNGHQPYKNMYDIFQCNNN
jgi:hypothetical protein